MQVISRQTDEAESTVRAENSAGPVDLQHLRRYTLGDQKLEREILRLFLTQLPDLTAALRTAQTERDWKMAAHSLKGSGRSIGAWRIACLAEGAERQPFSTGCEACKNAMCGLEEAASEVRLFINSVC